MVTDNTIEKFDSLIAELNEISKSEASLFELELSIKVKLSLMLVNYIKEEGMLSDIEWTAIVHYDNSIMIRADYYDGPGNELAELILKTGEGGGSYHHNSFNLSESEKSDEFRTLKFSDGCLEVSFDNTDQLMMFVDNHKIKSINLSLIEKEISNRKEDLNFYINTLVRLKKLYSQTKIEDNK